MLSHSQDGPFRATRSGSNIRSWPGGNRIISLRAPECFDTHVLLERAENQAERNFLEGVVDDDNDNDGDDGDDGNDGDDNDNDGLAPSPVCPDEGEPTDLAVERRAASPPVHSRGPSIGAAPFSRVARAKRSRISESPPPEAPPAKRVQRGSFSAPAPASAPASAPAPASARARAPETESKKNGPSQGAINAGAVHVAVGTAREAGPPSRTPGTCKETSKQRSKRRFKERRRVRRAKSIDPEGEASSAPKRVALSPLSDAVPIQTPLTLGIKEASGRAPSDGTSQPSVFAAPSGFVGARPEPCTGDDVALSLEEARGLGFRYVPWDGRTPHVILDREERVIGVLAGAPRDNGWTTVMEDGCKAVENARSRLGREEATHRRGTFSVIATGISYGGGQKKPCNRRLLKGERDVVDALLDDRAIKRIAGFGNSAFRLFAPKLHASYAANMKALLQWDSSLRPNFKRAVFGSITFNMGPRTETVRHTDFQNRAAGMCAVTALGSFDPKRGGHIILWELEMIIEFPPGSTILIPSALIGHSNTTVQPHERRFSITQYSAGGLFRFVECGFQTEKALLASGSGYEQTGEARWRRGLGLFSKWAELRASAV